MSITKGKVEEAKEKIREFLENVEALVYPVHFYRCGRRGGLDGRLEALAGALDWPIANKSDKSQLKDLVQRRLLGYNKMNGKYAVPGQRIWQSHGPSSGKFRGKLLKYVKKLLRSPSK